MIKGQVKIPEHPQWEARQSRCDYHESHPCIVCGKPIKNAFENEEVYWLRLGPGGKNYAIPCETPDQGGAEMGCEPVGNDCLRRNPELRKLAFRRKDAR